MDDPRIIILSGEVNERSALDVIVRLMSFDNEDHKSEISLYINSPGGSIDYGLAIYDVIRHIEAPVSTVCFGMAASMGAFLLSSGTKGKRYALPNSEIMIHQVLGGAQGQATDVEIQTKQLLKIKQKLNRLLAENVGRDITEVEHDTERDNYLSASEAKAYGIIDEVFTTRI